MHLRPTFVAYLALSAVLATVLASCTSAPPQPAQAPPVPTKPVPRKKRPMPGPPVGQSAPDFELVRLDAVLKEARGEKAQPRTLRLSSFRGERPVVVFFSSYT